MQFRRQILFCSNFVLHPNSTLNDVSHKQSLDSASKRFCLKNMWNSMRFWWSDLQLDVICGSTHLCKGEHEFSCCLHAVICGNEWSWSGLCHQRQWHWQISFQERIFWKDVHELWQICFASKKLCQSKIGRCQAGHQWHIWYLRARWITEHTLFISTFIEWYKAEIHTLYWRWWTTKYN